MVVSIVSVLTALEQRAELDRLVGLVVMHGPDVQTRQPQHEACRKRDRDDENRGRRAAGHFGEP